MTQAVQGLLCKCEPLSSNPSTTKKKKHYIYIYIYLFLPEGWEEQNKRYCDYLKSHFVLGSHIGKNQRWNFLSVSPHGTLKARRTELRGHIQGFCHHHHWPGMCFLFTASLSTGTEALRRDSALCLSVYPPIVSMQPA
jgi:hypothetical protein